MGTTTTQTPLLKTGLDTMAFGRNVSMRLFETLDESQWYTNPCKGGHHAAWIAGHLASTESWFRAELSGAEPITPESWGKLFGMKSESVEDRSLYPSKAELIAALSDTREALVAWLGGLGDDELLEPITGDAAGFASNRAMLMGSLTFHEAFHVGQLSVARRAQGIEPIF